MAQYRAHVDPSSGGFVASTIRADSSAVQHVEIVARSGDISVDVHSHAGGGALAVGLTDGTGAHYSELPVVGSVQATQAGAPWSFTGSATVTAAHSWRTFVTGSGGTVADVASTAGLNAQAVVLVDNAGDITAQDVTGTVTANQGGAPWTFTGSAAVTAADSWQVFVTGSGGTVADVASTAGLNAQAVVLVDNAGDVVAQDVTGTVTANQGGAPWSFTGSAAVTAADSWLVFVSGSGGAVADVASTAGFNAQAVVLVDNAGDVVAQDVTGTVTANQGGAPWSFTGSAMVTAAHSWNIFVTGSGGGSYADVTSMSAGGALRVDVVQTVAGGGGGTEYTEDVAAAGDPVGGVVMLVREDARGGGLTNTDGDNVAQRGNNKGEAYVIDTDAVALLTTIDADTDAIKTAVELIDNAISGTEMQVDIVAELPAGSQVIGSVGQDGAPWSVTGSMAVTAADSWQVFVTGSGGTVADVASTAGFNPQAVVLVDNTGTIAAQDVTGTVTANQGGAPWSVTGSMAVTAADSWVTFVAGSGGTVADVASTAGLNAQAVVLVDDAGAVVAQDVTGTVTANQGGSPWNVVGSTHVTPANSWLVGVVGSNGLQVGVTSYGDGHLLRVDVVQTAGGGGGGAIQDGTTAAIEANVRSTPSFNALAVVPVDSAGNVAIPVPTYVHDTAMLGGERGPVILGIRRDSDTSPVSADGDYHTLVFDNLGAVKVSAENLVSAEIGTGGNSRAAATLAGGATVTGDWENVHRFALITVLIDTPTTSKTGTLRLQFSMDGSTVHRSIDLSSVDPSVESPHSLIPVAKYFRVEYVADGSSPADDLSDFTIQTIYHSSKSKGLTSRVLSNIDANTDVDNVRAVIAGETGGGSFVNIKASAGGNFQIDLEEVGGTAIATGSGAAGDGTLRVIPATDAVTTTAPTLVNTNAGPTQITVTHSDDVGADGGIATQLDTGLVNRREVYFQNVGSHNVYISHVDSFAPGFARLLFPFAEMRAETHEDIAWWALTDSGYVTEVVRTEYAYN